MKIIKKLALTIAVLILSMSPVFADVPTPSPTSPRDDLTKALGLDKFKITDTLPIFRFSGIVDTILNLVFLAIILFFLVQIVKASFKIGNSGGDASKRQEGFKGLINGGIGFALGSLSLVLMNFALAALGISTPTSLLPNCSARSGEDKRLCQVNACKLIDPQYIDRDCKYIGGTPQGKSCKIEGGALCNP